MGIRVRVAARRERGFSLLELSAVLVIVGILAAFSIAGYRRELMRARAAATIQELIQIRVGLLRFEADCGGLPPWNHHGGDPGLCYAPVWAKDRWDGPYLAHWPETTPLGGTVVYESDGGSSETAPPSLGVDGLSGDADDLLSKLIGNTFGTKTAARAGRRGSQNPGAVSPGLGPPTAITPGSGDDPSGRRHSGH